MQGSLKVLCPLQPVGVDFQALGHGGVQHDVAAGDAVGGAQHTELEFIAGEGEGRGAVAVGGVPVKLGQHIHPQLHLGLFRPHIGLAGFYGLQHRVQLVAQEYAHHGGGRFVGPEPVVVAGGRHGDAQKVLIVVHGLYHRTQEQEELGVLIGGLTGGQQVHAGVRGDGPVIVLAAAVYPVKGFLVQKAHKAVLCRHLLHHLHGQLVVVGSDVDGSVDGGQLMLGGGHLVVLGLG